MLSTSAWVFSCKFAAYFQNNFSQEHLWTAASAECNIKLYCTMKIKMTLNAILPNYAETVPFHKISVPEN